MVTFDPSVKNSCHVCGTGSSCISQVSNKLINLEIPSVLLLFCEQFPPVMTMAVECVVVVMNMVVSIVMVLTNKFYHCG